jgi:hypothetical protein
MDAVETIVLRELWEIEPRLNELGLTRAGLLEARDVAIHDSANATLFHAANAAGTYSYHSGTWALRDRFVGGDWVLDRSDGVETIRNEKLKLKVGFSNVDLACDNFQIPKPRTKKGSGAERATGADLFGLAGLPQYAPKPTGEWKLYYLMVDGDGAAELTRPVVKRGTFSAALERIFLSSGNEGDGLLEDTADTIVEFEPQIARK